MEFRIFSPQRRFGVFFHFLLIALLLGLVGFGLWRASLAESALGLIYLTLAVVAGALLPLLVYRLYGLQNGSYSIASAGIRLRWGWRAEDIPSSTVEWVGYERQWDQALPRPFFSWPGAVVGERRLSVGRSVEFLADRAQNLVLIVTAQRVFAISPADPGDFLRTYHRLAEYGAIAPLSPQSSRPGFLSPPLIADPPGRLLLLGNLLLSFGLVALVALAVPSREQVSLRFTLQGQPLDYVPAVRLFLLPVLNLLFLVADIALGVVFYRRKELKPLAYLLWGAGLVTSGLFLAAVIFILSAS
jgi:hypothetical protein